MKRGALCRLVCVYLAGFAMLRESAIRKLLHTIFRNMICTAEQKEKEREREREREREKERESALFYFVAS